MMHICTHALQPDGDHAFRLHPDWQKREPWLRAAYRARWFATEGGDPGEWYAWLHGEPVLASLFPQARARAGECQVWLASPYHAHLMRDRFRLLHPEDFPWDEQDAKEVVALLQPLLHDYGMRLEAHGERLLLYSRRMLDVDVPSFTRVLATALPNRTPSGRDGLLWMRLMGEVQSLLFQQPSMRRRQAGWPALSGLWFWGGAPWPLRRSERRIPIYSRHPMLRHAHDAGAHLRIEASTPPARLPARLFLASEAQAQGVLLQRHYLPWRWARVAFDRAARNWRPTSPLAPASSLRELLLSGDA